MGSRRDAKFAIQRLTVMTDKEKIDALKASPDVKAFLEELDCVQKEETPASTVPEKIVKEPPLDILKAMRTILYRAEVHIERSYSEYVDSYYRYDDAFVGEVSKEAEFLASELEITPKQAVLFTIIVELSKGESVDAKELSQSLRSSFVELLGFDSDIKALQRARLIRRGRSGSFIVPDDVQKCLRANKPFHRPAIGGLTTMDILVRMSTLFHTLEDREDNEDEVVATIDEMILANPTTSIARAMDEYGILCHDAILMMDDMANDYDNAFMRKERMLFYALCFLYHDREEDNASWWMMRNYMESSTLQTLQSLFGAEILALQQSGIVTYAGDSSLVDKDHFKLSDEAKERILQDCGGLQPGGKAMPGVIDPEGIPEKSLFFDPDVERQVSRLENLLGEDRYREVENTLRSKGLRPGFTCLFYGAPGTGKTETVYQIAKRTGRGIMMADVSKLKSMWVGESEKNLKRLFSKYATCVRRYGKAPILCFNEADAIFGVRKSGAEDAVDKMENSLQNIILQEMENLRGILIATTNLTENLDKAFERRFLYKVHFENPSVGVKKKIWDALIPELGEGESEKLAGKYAFSGGQIENISRKRIVQSVLTGQEPTIEDIEQMCREEQIGSSGEKRRIGF